MTNKTEVFEPTKHEIEHDSICICNACLVEKINSPEYKKAKALREAAPELLKAAKEVQSLLGVAKEPRFIDAYERLCKAIIKAEGGK